MKRNSENTSCPCDDTKCTICEYRDTCSVDSVYTAVSNYDLLNRLMEFPKVFLGESLDDNEFRLRELMNDYRQIQIEVLDRMDHMAVNNQITSSISDIEFELDEIKNNMRLIKESINDLNIIKAIKAKNDEPKLTLSLLFMTDDNKVYRSTIVYTKKDIKTIKDFTPPKEDKAGEFLYIVISDTGVGLPNYMYKNADNSNIFTDSGLAIELATFND